MSRLAKHRKRRGYRPTAVKRRMVAKLAKAGVSQEYIAFAVGCSPATLRRHFREELLTAAAKRQAQKIDLMFSAAERGNVRANIKALDMIERAGAAAKRRRRLH